MLAWTCDKVVVTVARASAVIPDHLHEIFLEDREGSNKEEMGPKT